jgi:transcriptional regulator with XRE-family HTH domain
MSQRQLAAAIGTTQSAIWAIESGRRPLRLSEAVAICAALEVDLGAVVADEPLVLVAKTVIE